MNKRQVVQMLRNIKKNMKDYCLNLNAVYDEIYETVDNYKEDSLLGILLDYGFIGYDNAEETAILRVKKDGLAGVEHYIENVTDFDAHIFILDSGGKLRNVNNGDIINVINKMLNKLENERKEKQDEIRK